MKKFVSLFIEIYHLSPDARDLTCNCPQCHNGLKYFLLDKIFISHKFYNMLVATPVDTSRGYSRGTPYSHHTFYYFKVVVIFLLEAISLRMVFVRFLLKLFYYSFSWLSTNNLQKRKWHLCSLSYWRLICKSLHLCFNVGNRLVLWNWCQF